MALERLTTSPQNPRVAEAERWLAADAEAGSDRALGAAHRAVDYLWTQPVQPTAGKPSTCGDA